MKIYNKLVRDNIPEIIKRAGEDPKTRVLSDEEYLSALIKKLNEEYEEFKADESMEELADIQEVVNALAEELGGIDKLEEVRREKHKKRGGFKNRIFLESAD